MPRVRQTLLQVLGDFDFRERIEHDLFAQAMQPQLLSQFLERMRLRDDLHESIRAQPHDPRRRGAPREVIEQSQRRRVAPMQILGQQQERMLQR